MIREEIGQVERENALQMEIMRSDESAGGPTYSELKRWLDFDRLVRREQ